MSAQPADRAAEAADGAAPPGWDSLLPDLAPSATVARRVDALLRVGLSVDEIAIAINAARSSVRNWHDGRFAPRLAAGRMLDDLRATVVILSRAGLSPNEAAEWLRSLHDEHLPSAGRPLHTLAKDPVRVLSSARALVIEHENPYVDLHAVG